MIAELLDPSVITATSGLIAIIVVAAAMLRGWQGWLELKRQELDRSGSGSGSRAASEDSAGIGGARIELADLRERIRKLEAIASGVEL
jgi:hypothetical protein